MKVLRVKEDSIHKLIKRQALDKDMTVTDYLAYLITTEEKRINARNIMKK